MAEKSLIVQNSDQFFDQLPVDFWFEALRIMARQIKNDGAYYSGGDRGQYIATKAEFMSNRNGAAHDPYDGLKNFRDNQVLTFDWNNTAEYYLCDTVEEIVEVLHWELSNHVYCMEAPGDTLKNWPSFWGPVPTFEKVEELLPVLKTPSDLAAYLFAMP